MRLRQKIILFAIAPLVLALSAISLTVYHQATSLVQQERGIIKPAYLATKESELKNYVALATQAISHLYESGKTDAAIKDAARAILAKLEYSEDGYLFLYNLKGTMLMHPRLKESVGKNMWNLADPNGKMIIQDLIRIAQAGAASMTMSGQNLLQTAMIPSLSAAMRSNFLRGDGCWEPEFIWTTLIPR
jgi:two-component system NarL family sensor kinase